MRSVRTGNKDWVKRPGCLKVEDLGFINVLELGANCWREKERQHFFKKALPAVASLFFFLLPPTLT